MPRIHPLFALCLWILTGTFVMVGQEEDVPSVLVLDMPMQFSLDGTSPTFFAYEGTAGEFITITLRSLADMDNPLNDPVLEIWGVDGRRIAYNDDAFVDIDENPNTAHLANVSLRHTGTYLIRADTYGGIYAGTFEILLVQSDPFQRIATDDGFIIHLPSYAIFIHVLTLEAGQTITLTAQTLSGGLDPYIWITDAAGMVIASNDDHASNDFSLNVLDARIADLSIIQTGDYTLHVRDFLGRSGHIRLTIMS